MNLIKNLVITIIFLFITLPVQAAWYQVEVIVFEYLYPELDGELWYENPGLPPRYDSIEIIESIPGPVERKFAEVKEGNAEEEPEPDEEELTPYLALPPEKFRLQDVYRVLRLSRDYRPLLHVAWQQPGLDRKAGRAVHLEKTMEVEELDDSLPPELAAIQIEEADYRPPEMIFDGTIRVRSAKYLHADVDFAYFPQAFIQTLKSQQQSANRNYPYINQHADYVRLQESRRIRLNELHYFDHSMFGVILQVSRIETE